MRKVTQFEEEMFKYLSTLLPASTALVPAKFHKADVSALCAVVDDKVRFVALIIPESEIPNVEVEGGGFCETDE